MPVNGNDFCSPVIDHDPRTRFSANLGPLLRFPAPVDIRHGTGKLNDNRDIIVVDEIRMGQPDCYP